MPVSLKLSYFSGFSLYLHTPALHFLLLGLASSNLINSLCILFLFCYFGVQMLVLEEDIVVHKPPFELFHFLAV